MYVVRKGRKVLIGALEMQLQLHYWPSGLAPYRLVPEEGGACKGLTLQFCDICLQTKKTSTALSSLKKPLPQARTMKNWPQPLKNEVTSGESLGLDFTYIAQSFSLSYRTSVNLRLPWTTDQDKFNHLVI